MTHNIGKMAKEAGIYKALWQPQEEGYQVAGDIEPVLKAGLDKLCADPQHYEQLDSTYGAEYFDRLVTVASSYLEVCREHPKANIEVSR